VDEFEAGVTVPRLPLVPHSMRSSPRSTGRRAGSGPVRRRPPTTLRGAGRPGRSWSAAVRGQTSGDAVKKLVKRFVPVRYHASLRKVYRRLKRATGPVFRALPSDSTAFGPPRGYVATLKELAVARPHEATFREFYPAHAVKRPEPVTDVLPIRPEFLPYLSVRVPAAGVAVLRGARVVGRHGKVITPHDELVGDASPEFETDWFDMAIATQLRLPPIRAVDGPLGVAGAWASHNYSHWLFDVLPKFHLIERSGIAVRSVAVDQRTVFQRQTLELLRFPAELIPLDEHTHLTAERLIVPALAIWPRNFPTWACRFLRETFLPVATAPAGVGRRLFISRRGGGRVITNEASLLERLGEAGFSVIRAEDLSFREQVAAFAGAEMIVAPHGAGLTNIVFCRPGTRILEIFDPTYVNVVFWVLANQLGLQHRYFMGERRTERPEPSWSGFANIVVDERRFMAAVRDAAAR
jgi:capsular polysaccharide biosynthesis protein